MLGDRGRVRRHLVHLENQDVAFRAVSRAPLPKLQACRQRMGWTFPWASSRGSDFNFDYDVAFTKDDKRQVLLA